MNDFCQWLYANYAAPRFDEEKMPESYRCQKEEWLTYAQTLPNHERLLSLDLIDNMKRSWGMQAFTCGFQAGLLLAMEIFPGDVIFPAAL